MIVGAIGDQAILMIMSGLGMVGCVIAGARMARTLVPTRIDDTHAWFKAGAPFVSSLPERSDLED
jgi:hypothetical protein